VDKAAREKASWTGEQVDDKTKTSAFADAAGVELYSVAASGWPRRQVAQADAVASPEVKKRAEEARKAGNVQLSNERVLRGSAATEARSTSRTC